MDAIVLRGLAEMHGEFLRFCGLKQIDVAKGDLAEIDEDGAIAQGFDTHGRLCHEVRGCGAGCHGKAME